MANDLRPAGTGGTPASDAPVDVIGLGAACIDDVYYVPRLPTTDAASEKVPITRHRRRAGGQAATTLAASARLGLSARFAGALGRDGDGEWLSDELAGLGIDVSWATGRDASTARAVIVVNATDGERLVLWQRSPALTADLVQVSAAMDVGARLLHVDDVDPLVAIDAARYARSRGLPVTSDMDHVTPEIERLFELVTVPVLAAHVPALLTGEPDWERALRQLGSRRQGPVYVTLGSSGAAVVDRGELLQVAAIGVTAIDATGAGDVFRAGVVYGTLSGWPAGRTLTFANAAAGLSCRVEGAMSGAPTLDEVLAAAAQPTHRRL